MTQGQQRMADLKEIGRGIWNQTPIGRAQTAWRQSAERWGSNGMGGLMKWDQSAITPWIEQGFIGGGGGGGGYRTPATEDPEELQRRYEAISQQRGGYGRQGALGEDQTQSDWQRRLQALASSNLYERYRGSR